MLTKLGSVAGPAIEPALEVWRAGADGLIAESRGYFDSAAYQHQLEHGIEGAGQ